MDREFTRAQMQVCRRVREMLQLGVGECREQGNRPDVVDGEHGFVQTEQMR
jgi:hypothetical protein